MPAASSLAHTHGASPAARRAGDARRRPEDTLLYEVIREHRPEFRDRAAESGYSEVLRPPARIRHFRKTILGQASIAGTPTARLTLFERTAESR